MNAAELAIVKQCAAKATSFGFPNNPHGSTVECVANLSETVWVAKVSGLVDAGDVFALVVDKGHSPLAASHVVDFRIGGDIYSETTP